MRDACYEWNSFVIYTNGNVKDAFDKWKFNKFLQLEHIF